MPDEQPNNGETSPQVPPANLNNSNPVNDGISPQGISLDQAEHIVMVGLSPAVGAVGVTVNSALWLKEEINQRNALSDKDAYKSALKDPIVAELVQRREDLSNEIIACKLAQKNLRKTAGENGMSAEDLDMHLQAIDAYRGDLDKMLTDVVSDRRMQELRGLETNVDLADEVLKRRGAHLLNGSGILASAVSTGISSGKAALNIANTVNPALAPVSAAGTMALGAVSMPVSTVQAVISATKAVQSVREFRESGRIKEKAKGLRTEFADDPMLSAIAKRMQTKHEKNRYTHAFDAVSNGASTVSSVIAATGAATTLTVGLAAGAGTMGAGTVAVAAPFLAGAGVASAVSASASAGNVAFKLARNAVSKDKKLDCKEAMNCMHKLRSAGIHELDTRSDKVKQILKDPANIELASSGIKVDVIKLPKPEPTVAMGDGSQKALEGFGHLPGKISTKEKLASFLMSGKAKHEMRVAKEDGLRGQAPPVDNTGQNTLLTPEQVEKMKDKGLTDKLGDALSNKANDLKEFKNKVVDNAVKEHVSNALDRPGMGVEVAHDPDSGPVLTYQELEGLKRMQDHAVKHWMRGAEPLIPNLTKELARLQKEATPDKYQSKKSMKALEKEIASDLRAQLKAEAYERFKDVDKLMNHTCEVMVARDTTTAMKHLAGRLRQDCGEALLNRNMSSVTKADLPDTPSVQLVRKMGVDDKQIARIVTAVSHADTLKTGQETLARKFKLRSN